MRRSVGLGIVISFLASLSAFAETPSSPAELAVTAQLNRDVAAANAAADARYEAAMKLYSEQKRQNDMEQQHYQEELRRNTFLQQEYQDKLHDYQKAYSNRI